MLVPIASLVRSRVVPAGIAMLLRVIVEHDAFPLIAEAAVVNVQLARSCRDAGAAETKAPAPSKTVTRRILTMLLTRTKRNFLK